MQRVLISALDCLQPLIFIIINQDIIIIIIFISNHCYSRRQWIAALYNNISSWLLNNGIATKHFNLNRGVRQGCTHSGIFFVTGVEVLRNAVKRSRAIEGIQIDPNHFLRSHFADDTTLFVKDIGSVHRLFDLLQRFENCSDLRINQSKSDRNPLIGWDHYVRPRIIFQVKR